MSRAKYRSSVSRCVGVVTALCFVACGGDEEPKLVCGDADEGEVGPNNALEGAPEVSFGRDVAGCVDVVGDIDHYRVAVRGDKPGLITFTLTPRPPEEGASPGRISLAMFLSGSSTAIASFSATEAGAALTGYLSAAAGKTYVFKVQNASFTTFGGAYGYDLALTWDELDDRYEPNDFWGVARSISRGKTIKGRLFAGHQASSAPAVQDFDDWYAVKLSAAPVTISVDPVPESVAARLELRNDAGAVLSCPGCIGQAGQPLVVSLDAVEAGTYRVNVSRHVTPMVPSVGLGPPPAFATKDYGLRITQP